MEVNVNTFIKNLITPQVYNKIFKNKIKDEFDKVIDAVDKVNIVIEHNINQLIVDFYKSETFKDRANIYCELIRVSIFETILENCVPGFYSTIGVEELDDITYSFVGSMQEEDIDNSCIKDFIVKMLETYADNKGFNGLLKEYKDKKCGRPQMPQGQPINLPKVMTP